MTYPLLIAVGAILLYLFFYYMAGSIAVHFVPASDFSFARTLFLGFFIYHFLFSAVTMPMKCLLLPLSWLSVTWAAVLAAVAVAFILLERKQWRWKWDYLRSLFTGSQKYVTLGLLALILLQVIWFNLNDETYALWDQSYYLGDTATSLYTNTISQYDPYTGKILGALKSEYLFETLQNHDAVMSQLLRMHPMIEVLTVSASTVIIIYQLIMVEIGKHLFKNSSAKALLFLGFLFLLNLFSFNLYTAAEFLIIRPSEGKTILAALIIPAVFFCFLKTAGAPDRHTFWCYSFFVILGSFGLNMSSIFMVPFELTALYIPLAVSKKKLRVVIRYLILLIPCAVMAVLYLLTKTKFHIYIGK